MDGHVGDAERTFYLTDRGDAPQVPDFDGRGARLCSVAETWVSANGKEFWLIDVEPPVSGWGVDGSHLVIACRHGGVSLHDVFEGKPVYVHVVAIDTWDNFKRDIAEGTATSHYWGEIVSDRQSIPDIIPSS